jgi:hypothetical protein
MISGRYLGTFNQTNVLSCIVHHWTEEDVHIISNLMLLLQIRTGET